MNHTRLDRDKGLLEYLKWESLGRNVKRVLLHNNNRYENKEQLLWLSSKKIDT
jgi:hypothetical protein